LFEVLAIMTLHALH